MVVEEQVPLSQLLRLPLLRPPVEFALAAMVVPVGITEQIVEAVVQTPLLQSTSLLLLLLVLVLLLLLLSDFTILKSYVANTTAGSVSTV